MSKFYTGTVHKLANNTQLWVSPDHSVAMAIVTYPTLPATVSMLQLWPVMGETDKPCSQCAMASTCEIAGKSGCPLTRNGQRFTVVGIEAKFLYSHDKNFCLVGDIRSIYEATTDPCTKCRNCSFLSTAYCEDVACPGIHWNRCYEYKPGVGFFTEVVELTLIGTNRGFDSVDLTKLRKSNGKGFCMDVNGFRHDGTRGLVNYNGQPLQNAFGQCDIVRVVDPATNMPCFCFDRISTSLFYYPEYIKTVESKFRAELTALRGFAIPGYKVEPGERSLLINDDVILDPCSGRAYPMELVVGAKPDWRNTINMLRSLDQ